MSAATPSRVPLGSPWRPRPRSGMLGAWYLRRFDRRRALLERLGLQPEAFLRILELKLENDARGADGRAKGVLTLGLAVLFATSWLAGFLPGMLLLFVKPPALWWMASVSATLGFLLLLVMLGLYDTLLVDATDVAVIASLPVSDRTLYAARLAHLSFYVALMSLLICFWPMFLGPFGFPWWAVFLGVPLTAALTALFAVGAVALLYALVLRILGPGRFQRASLYAQVAALVLTMVGPQLISRLSILQPLVQAFRPEWALLLPPAWFGGLFSLLLGQHDALTLALAALALLVPLLMLVVALRLASRHFVAALAAGSTGDRAGRARWRRPWSAGLARLVCRGESERTGWLLALPLVRRDRVFVRGAWPGFLGSTLIGVVIFLPLPAHGHALPAGLSLCGLYMCALAFSALLQLMKFSEHARARWLYAVAPVSDAAGLARGAAKALLVCVLLPAQLIASLIGLALGGLERAPLVPAVLATSACVGLFAVPLLVRSLPFTHEQTPGRTNTDAIGPAFLYSFAIAGAATLQTLLCLHWIGAIVLGIVLCVLLPLAWRRLGRLKLDPMPPV